MDIPIETEEQEKGTAERPEEAQPTPETDGGTSQPSERQEEFEETNAPAGSEAPPRPPEPDWKDLCLRTMAELENARKVIPKRIEEGIAYFKRDHALRLLDVADGFERALGQGGAEEGQGWRQGLESLHRLFLETLRRSGLERLEAAEGSFDPALHEAVAAVPAPGRADGEILAVQRSGWRMEGRLLRPASVVVVRNPESEEEQTKE